MRGRLRPAGTVKPPQANEDGGFALAVALVIVLIIFILVSAALAQVAFDFSQGGKMERRVKAANAAEAGLAWYVQQLEAPLGTVRALTTKPWKTLSSDHFKAAPSVAVLSGASFEVEVWYLSTDPCTTVANVICTASSATPFSLKNASEPLQDPLFAIVRATGIAGEVSRTFEVALRLHPKAGTGLPNTIVASGMCLGPGSDIVLSGDLGFTASEDFPAGYGCTGKDIVLDGHKFSLTSGELLLGGAANFQATGSGTRVELNGLLWVGGNVSLGRTTNNLNDTAPDTTCGGGIKICAKQDVYYAPNGLFVGVNAAILGSTSSSEGPAPLAGNFPSYTWNAAAWTAENWTVVDDLRWSSQDSIDWSASKTVFHVTSGTCPFTFDKSLPIGGDIAVVSDTCGFVFEGSSGFPGTGGLTFMTLQGDATCGPGGGSNIVIRNGPTFGSRPSFFYTPCVLEINNNGGGLTGQLYGKFLYFENPNSVSFINVAPSSIPGPTVGFSAETRYVREVTV